MHSSPRQPVASVRRRGSTGGAVKVAVDAALSQRMQQAREQRIADARHRAALDEAAFATMSHQQH
ncbi:MAG TPA: hypothetical protein VJK90_00195 [Acetobacteraceae bacterium]|nr:hypothetical protein [Acetobacteraceae bacterium]